MKEKTINVIIKRPGEPAVRAEIPGTLQRFQEEVGGYIEDVLIHSGLHAVVNDEGRLLGLPGNICGLYGTIIFASVKNGEYADIDEQAADLLEAGYFPFQSGANLNERGGTNAE